MNKKVYRYNGEELILKEGTIEELKENYGKRIIYFTYDNKTGTPIWHITYECTEENKSRTVIYGADIGEYDFSLYEKIGCCLGYLYDEERLKWIQKITNYKKVKPEDVF